MKLISTKILSITALILLTMTALETRACSVPVFRFALERWRNDPYEIFILHKGPFSKDEKKIYDLMENIQYERGGFTLIDADSEKQDEKSSEIWKRHGKDKLPMMVVRFPEWVGMEEDAWSGAFTKKNAGLVLDSPSRRKISELIIKGESAVWLFIESSDKKKNKAKHSLLKKELKKLAEKLTLSDMTEEETTADIETASPVEISKSFKIINISRKNPSEKAFLEMLRSYDKKIAEDAPVTIPIFGRGRALYPLVGEGIEADEIAGICSFILGPCSCQVKELNPGIDLLIAFDWEKHVFYSIGDFEVPPLTGFEGFISKTKTDTDLKKPKIKPAASTETVTSVEKDTKEKSVMFRNLALLISVIIIFIIIFSIYAVKKEKESSRVENGEEDKS